MHSIGNRTCNRHSVRSMFHCSGMDSIHNVQRIQSKRHTIRAEHTISNQPTVRSAARLECIQQIHRGNQWLLRSPFRMLDTVLELDPVAHAPQPLVIHRRQDALLFYGYQKIVWS